MNKIIQDLATSLDVLSPALETIAQKTIIIDSFRKTVLDQARSGYVPSTSTELAEISKFSQDAHLILEHIKEAENTTRVAYECSQTLLFSPIRKLPPEILTKMFHDHIFSQSEYALGVESQDNGEIVLVPPTLITCPSLHLGWVCSHWRQVEFIFRSGNDSPLKLYIMNRNDNSLDAYSDHSARWSHVVLGVPSTWFARHSVEAGTFPNLKHLDVMFTSCPRLDTYIGRSFEWSTFKVHDFSHLTMLSLEELYAERVAPFLSLLPALKTFSLALDLDDNTADIAPPISYFFHRNLSALHLTTNVDTYQLTKGRLRDKYFSDMSSLFVRNIRSFTSLTIGTVDWEVLDGIMLASLSKAAAASYDYPDVAPKLQSLVINFGRITGSELSELGEDTNWLDKLVEFAHLRLLWNHIEIYMLRMGEDEEQLGLVRDSDIKNRLASVRVGFTLHWGDSILYQTFVLE
ncbi:hypothetical protein BT96DRAFT_927604 [Gymnopus androsaceus JB14]|uniref:Uncharacterized protein n=1 Tax=Gymnopus androsaceus JB14 TaxID=1447944 RepID=A0A6A4GQ82_9AGAR|nr:hypothetical protein BT96DRAFT_927604 [Gymnopus androsaceus JB14]